MHGYCRGPQLAVSTCGGYNALVNRLSPSQKALNRLLAASWDPQSLPETDAIPWNVLLPLVEASDFGALVYRIARDMQPAPPAKVMLPLEQAYYRLAAANTRVLHQLGTVRGALSPTGAPLLLLKGAAMAQALYPDPILRAIGDIDLVIPPEHVPACRRRLLDLGYLPSLVDHQHGIPFTHTNEEAYAPPEPGQAMVELHWHVLDVPYYMRNLPMDWFWQNTQEMQIAGQPFLVLNPKLTWCIYPLTWRCTTSSPACTRCLTWHC